MTLAEEPGMPGMSKLGKPPVSATWTSISLSSRSPDRSFLRKLSRVASEALAPTSASSTRASALSWACASTSLRRAALTMPIADFEQVADHLVDIAPDIADLGEFRGLHLDEGCIGEPGEAPGDLGLADAGRPDHQDVLRHHLFAHRALELLAPPAIAQRDRHGALGVVLADDVAVEFGNDLAGRKIGHSRLSSVTLVLV